MPSAAETRHPARASTDTSQVSIGWSLVALCLAVLQAQLGATILNIGLPNLMDVFGASFGAVQWVMLSYLLAVTALIVSVGRLGDVIGKKRLLLIGLAVFTLASAACGAAPSLGLLMAARVVQGLGGAILMALTFALVAEIVPKRRSGYAMGVLGTTSSVATTLAPSLGGLLLAGLGWRSLFLINVPLGVLAYVIARRHLPEARRAASPSPSSTFDWTGTIVLVAVLVAYSLAMTQSRVSGFGDSTIIGLLIAAATGTAVFVVLQARAKAPLVDLRLFRDVGLASGAVMSLLVAAIMMTTLLLAPFFLSRAVGLASQNIGLVMAVGPLTAALVGVPAGRLSDRIGASWTMVAGLVGLSAGVFWMAQVPADVGVVGYALRVAVISGSYGFFQTPNNAAVMAAARADQRGVVSSLLNLSRNLGFITGASLMGTVFAGALQGSGRVVADVANASPEALTSGMHAAFGLATGMSLVALLLAALTLYETIVRKGQRAL